MRAIRSSFLERPENGIWPSGVGNGLDHGLLNEMIATGLLVGIQLIDYIYHVLRTDGCT